MVLSCLSWCLWPIVILVPSPHRPKHHSGGCVSHQHEFEAFWEAFKLKNCPQFTYEMYFLVLATVCITCKNTHSNSFLLFAPHHSKSCGQLTSTTWVWICGQQHTSTPSRRFSRFTTRPDLSSHRHTCVSPASVFLSLSGSHCLWLDECLFFFFFPSLEPEPKMFESNLLLHSHQQKQEIRTKVCGHLLLENPQVLCFSAKLNRKTPSFLLFLNLKGVKKITFHYKWMAGSKDVSVIDIATSGCSHTFDLSASSDFAQKYFLRKIIPQDVKSV